VALGDQNIALGTAAIAQGQNSYAISDGTIALGQTARALATNAIAIGTMSTATGFDATAVGNSASAKGPNSSAFGTNAVAASANATAVGNSAAAMGPNSSAYGTNAVAGSANATAIGAGATVNAGAVNSSAIGTGAVASLSNQMVLGTSSQTYTAPGMNSDLSRARQSGLLGVVTSDAAGNLASDNGALYKQIAGIKAGAAVAMALADPYLTGTQNFGVKMNWGGFDGANAMGFSAAGVLGRGLLLKGDQLTLSAAAGMGESNVSGYYRTMFGGHAGMQLSW
jgi:hypothetical protein